MHNIKDEQQRRNKMGKRFLNKGNKNKKAIINGGALCVSLGRLGG